MDWFDHKLRIAEKARKQFEKEKNDYTKVAGFCPYDPFLRGFAYGWDYAHKGWFSKLCDFGMSAIHWMRDKLT